MRVKSIATEASKIHAVLGIASRPRPPPLLPQLELDFAAALPLHPCVRWSAIEPRWSCWKPESRAHSRLLRAAVDLRRESEPWRGVRGQEQGGPSQRIQSALNAGPRRVESPARKPWASPSAPSSLATRRTARKWSRKNWRRTKVHSNRVTTLSSSCSSLRLHFSHLRRSHAAVATA
jgi:hypothetical protein